MTGAVLKAAVEDGEFTASDAAAVRRFEGEAAAAFAGLDDQNPNLTVDNNFLTLTTF